MLLLFLIVSGLVFVTASDQAVLPVIGLGLGVAVAFMSLLPLVGRNLRRTPLPIWGMVIAHLGCAVALIGMSSDALFFRERLAAVAVGDTVKVGDFEVTLADVKPVVGPNWTALEARLSAKRGDDVYILAPQSRFFAQPATETNEAALLTVWGGQLYAVLGQQVGDDRWQLRLWWKPLVWWIWGGGIMIALGGLLALIGRLRPVDFIKRTLAARAERRGNPWHG